MCGVKAAFVFGCGTAVDAILLAVVATVLSAGAVENSDAGISYENPLWKHEVYDVSWMKAADG